MLAFGIYISHGIACYVAIDLAWNKYVVDQISGDRYRLLWEYVVRTVIVLITCKNFHFFAGAICITNSNFSVYAAVVLAVAIPKLDLFITLFGALCLSILGVAFPAIIDTLVFGKEFSGHQANFMYAKNIAIVAFGLFALVSGVSTSCLAIYQSFFE